MHLRIDDQHGHAPLQLAGMLCDADRLRIVSCNAQGEAQMADHQDVVAKLERALAAANACTTAETTENYEVLAEELQELAQLAQRAVDSDAYSRALVGKLRAGTPLTADETATLRLLIVGDADYYLKYDEEFERCRSDTGRILAEIQRLRTDGVTTDTLMHLSVLCREACSMLAPTQHYFEARDRVRRFEEATKGPIDRDAGRTLAGIIDGMIGQ
jgi:hypothetical protein